MNKEELKAKYSKKSSYKEWTSTNIFVSIVVTFFGAGTLPKMPGTWGSLAAAICAYPLALLFYNILPRFEYFNLGFFAIALFAFFLPIPCVNKAMQDSNTKDPGWIVIDEVCGQWMTLFLLPCSFILQNPWILLVAFVLFRLFDILKPLGIHRLEKLKGAVGVMADDLLGGLYAGILIFVLHALIRTYA